MGCTPWCLYYCMNTMCTKMMNYELHRSMVSTFWIAQSDVQGGIPVLGHQTSVCCSLWCPSTHCSALERAQSQQGEGWPRSGERKSARTMNTRTANDPVWDHEHMVTHVSQTLLYNAFMPSVSPMRDTHCIKHNAWIQISMPIQHIEQCTEVCKKKAIVHNRLWNSNRGLQGTLTTP